MGRLSRLLSKILFYVYNTDYLNCTKFWDASMTEVLSPAGVYCVIFNTTGLNFMSIELGPSSENQLRETYNEQQIKNYYY